MQDINFNIAYGDISFTHGKIDMLIKESPIVLQKIIQVLKTNFEDYKHFPEYGANIEEFIGEPIDKNLADRIQGVVLSVINSEDVLPSLNKFNLPYVIQKNTILFRLIVDDYISLKLDFEKDKGFKLEDYP